MMWCDTMDAMTLGRTRSVNLTERQNQTIDAIVDQTDDHPLLTLNQSEVLRLLLDAGIETLHDDADSPALRLVDSDDPITLGDMIDLEEAMVEE